MDGGLALPEQPPLGIIDVQNSSEINMRPLKSLKKTVIPAQAESRFPFTWIPAFAGMTLVSLVLYRCFGHYCLGI